MHLVQLFLPVYGNDGERLSKALFDRVRAELTDTFGGMTAFVRAPALGLWEDEDGELCRDDVVLFEVMVDTLDRAWWRTYRHALERRFGQEEIMIRATATERL